MFLPMKKIIISIVVAVLAIPSFALAIDWVPKRSGKIYTDESGGYSESQRDYKAKRTKKIEEDTKGGYYEKGYHSQSTTYEPSELQVVKKNKGGSSHTKKYKKVKEKSAE